MEGENQISRRNAFGVTLKPHEKMCICPYNPAHSVVSTVFKSHLDSCRRQYVNRRKNMGEDTKRKRCRTCRKMYLEPELETHGCSKPPSLSNSMTSLLESRRNSSISAYSLVGVVAETRALAASSSSDDTFYDANENLGVEPLGQNYIADNSVADNESSLPTAPVELEVNSDTNNDTNSLNLDDTSTTTTFDENVAVLQLENLRLEEISHALDTTTNSVDLDTNNVTEVTVQQRIETATIEVSGADLANGDATAVEETIDSTPLTSDPTETEIINLEDHIVENTTGTLIFSGIISGTTTTPRVSALTLQNQESLSEMQQFFRQASVGTLEAAFYVALAIGRNWAGNQHN